MSGANGLNSRQLAVVPRADLLRRWQRGERIRAEDCLLRHPTLQNDAEVLLDLLCTEAAVRLAQGETLHIEEYVRRLPQLAAPIRQHLEAMAATHAEPSPTPFLDPVADTLVPASPAPGQTDTLMHDTEGLEPPQTGHPSPVPTMYPGSIPCEMVGDYEVLGELGRGGMGVVYRARQRRLNRVVALKMILAGSHAGPEELSRFRREAAAIACLQHPNIVQVHESGEYQGKPFFSLEFIDGGSLDRKLNAAPLPPREAAALVETLARAMHAAHEQGIIHRDLKPANVLLTKDGTPKITDFGLAKKLDEAGLSLSGAVMGTPSYMAPEQASGQVRAIDARTDVYALGAVLYECLTGRPPFRAATAMDTLMQVLQNEPVPPGRLAARCPRELETICLKCLEKQQDKRYDTAVSLAEDLRRFQSGESIAARPAGTAERAVKWVKRRPLVSALLALIALLAVGGAAGILTAYSVAVEQEKAARHESEQAREAERKTGIERDRALKAEADAKAQKKTADEERSRAVEETRRARRALAQSKIAEAEVAWSAGDAIAARGRLEEVATDLREWEWRCLTRITRGSLYTLAGHTTRINGVAVSADGLLLASASHDGTVKVWDVRTGKDLLTLAGHAGPVSAAAFSPDGRLGRCHQTLGRPHGKGTLQTHRTRWHRPSRGIQLRRHTSRLGRHRQDRPRVGCRRRQAPCHLQGT